MEKRWINKARELLNKKLSMHTACSVELQWNPSKDDKLQSCMETSLPVGKVQTALST